MKFAGSSSKRLRRGFVFAILAASALLLTTSCPTVTTIQNGTGPEIVPIRDGSETPDGELPQTASGTVNGRVFVSTTGDGLQGVRVYLAESAEFAPIGVETAVEFERTLTSTDGEGHFSLNLAAGTHVLRFRREAYVIDNYIAVVPENGTLEIPDSAIIANHVLPGGQYRIVLTWGHTPRDIDSHLLLPNGFHVYFADKLDNIDNSAYLDIDDVTSFGPETITVERLLDGTGRYFVYNWSQDSPLGLSGAVVRVYNSNDLLLRVAIEDAHGDPNALYWTVFDFDETRRLFTVRNTLSNDQPSYAAPRD